MNQRQMREIRSTAHAQAMFIRFIGWLLGGVAVVEMVFSWPGLGNMAIYAITMRDYPLIEGFVLWVALAYMCINALVDASYILLDPRLKRERA